MAAQETFALAMGLLVVGPLVIRIALLIFAFHLPGVSSLLGIVAALCVLPVSWTELLIALVPFALGFVVGQSTHILRAPGDPLSSIRVPPRIYDRHQEILREFRTSRQGRQMMADPYVSSSLKMHLTLDAWQASFYRCAPLVALLAASAFILWWTPGFADAGWIVRVGICTQFGWCMGTLVKFIRGRCPPSTRHFNGILLCPTWNSFARSVAIDLLPFFVVAVSWYILPNERKSSLWAAASIASSLVTCWALITTIHAHRCVLCMDGEGIGMRVHGRFVGVLWSDVTAVTLRERYNLLSGRDRLLVLHCAAGKLAYPLSVLSDEAQQHALSTIRRAAPMSVKFDVGTL